MSAKKMQRLYNFLKIFFNYSAKFQVFDVLAPNKGGEKGF